ncbi:MAG: SMC family ATPase, partial [Anaerolineae bacterium]|nr:SMC family ATPase [Anaerolineae bacterium]
MIPLRLELKNFLAYRSPDPLRFDGIHLACLIGSNGAGKSSLLDAITWALWGTARAKRDDELVHMGQTDMMVQLDFDQEGTTYRVVRKRSRKGRGTGALDLFSVIDGHPNTLSEPSIRETQEKINRLLRLDYETFTSSAFLQQGKADAFTTKAPAQRKQILSDILGLSQWEKYEEAAKERLKTLANELAVIEQRIKDIEEELAKEPRLKQILGEAEAAQQEAEAALKIAEEKLAEVADSPAQMKAAQERKAEVERHRREREKDMQAISSDIVRQEARIKDYQAVIERRDEIEAGYAALQSARDADTALGDKLIQLSDFDAARRDLETRLRDARAELESEASGYTAQITELQRALEQADAEALSNVQAEVTELQTIEASRNGLQDQMATMNEDGASLRSLLKTLEDDGKKQGIRIDQLKATSSATCPLCGQPLDEQHRLKLVDELEVELATMRATYREHQERSQIIKAETGGFRTQITEWDTELKRLQPLMKQVGELQAQMDRANEAETRLTEISAK